MAENERETPCGVCGHTREYHGDMNHVFSEEGILQTKREAPPVPQRTPPEELGTTARITQNAFLRLIEVLVARNLLDGEDLVRIFGGDSSNRGPASQGTEKA